MSRSPQRRGSCFGSARASLSRGRLFATRPHGLHNSCNSPGRKTGVGSLSRLQGIFPTQGPNPGFPHCRRTLYQSFSQLIIIFIWAARGNSWRHQGLKTENPARAGGRQRERGSQPFLGDWLSQFLRMSDLYALFGLVGGGVGGEYTNTSLAHFYPFLLLGSIFYLAKKNNHLPVLYTHISPLITGFKKEKKKEKM